MRHVIIPTEAFPLAWPDGVPRTPRPRSSAFVECTQSDAIAEVRAELRLMGARTMIISTNLPTRQDGLPMASSTVRAGDHGAAVYWTEMVQGRLAPHVMTCDRWNRLGCNLHAIALSLRALRGLERWGAVRREQAFAGMRELPAAAGADAAAPRPWREVLGMPPPLAAGSRSAALELNQARLNWRVLMRQHHPDLGGDPAAAADINRAMDEAERELKASMSKGG